MKISITTTKDFLQTQFGINVSNVQPIGKGAWSHAFSFVQNNQKQVIRWSHLNDNFERDSLASTYNQENLPIPTILEMGKHQDYFFAISTFVSGDYLEKLTDHQLKQTLPSLLKTLQQLRAVNISSKSGFGFWNKRGEGSHSTWKEFLLDDKNDSKGSLINGWRKNLETSPLPQDIHQDLWDQFKPLVNKCPEVKNLVHSDLLNYNVLVEHNKISAVLDWGSSFYGDSLYDIAWFTFYEPWYPHFTEINLISELLNDFQNDSSTNKENLDIRLKCFQLHIGLDSIAYNCFNKDWHHAQEASDRAHALFSKK